MAVSASQATGRSLFEIAFQISPIVFQGGIADYVGGYLPIVVLTEGLSVVNGLIAGDMPTSLGDFFAQFTPLPGGALAKYSLGKFPFANQAVAGNAIIKDVRNIALRMIAPAQGPGGYLVKLATMGVIEAAISSHCNAGGTFIVMTPSFIYNSCILLDLQDVTSRGSQTQVEWMWSFTQPLISLSSAQAALNNLMNRLSNGGQITTPSWAGVNATNASALPLPSGISASTTGIAQSFTPAVQQPVFSQPLSAP